MNDSQGWMLLGVLYTLLAQLAVNANAVRRAIRPNGMRWPGKKLFTWIGTL
jgi:hypothetical protein